MSQNKVITKAVIAAAGFGTRFLPQTKAMPKEMLPLIDKPVIQYVVEELVNVGVKDIIIVTGYSKRAIEDHFDKPNEDLRNNLIAGGPKKAHYIKMIDRISDMANFIYVRQKGIYGSATPLLNTEHLLGDEPFYYTWSDDFFKSKPLRFKQMLDSYNKYKAPILSCMEVNKDQDYERYGICGGKMIDDSNLKIDQIIEKPGIKKAPSNLASVSGYILTKDIFKYCRQVLKDLPKNREFYAVDAINLMAKNKKLVIGNIIQNGKYYDLGNIMDYHKTVIDFALNNKELAPELKQYIRKSFTL